MFYNIQDHQQYNQRYNSMNAYYEGAQGVLSVPHDDSNVISRSADYSKTITRSQTKVDLEVQVSQLKERAHKSFLQVMQMQYLHEEQMEQLRDQYQQKQNKLNLLNEQLTKKINSLEIQLKSSLKNEMNLSNSSFTLDNIEFINCAQILGPIFQEDSLLNVKQLLTKNNNEETLQDFKKQLYKTLNIPKFTDRNQQQKKSSKIIQRIFQTLTELTEQNITLKQKLEKVNQSLMPLQTQLKNLKIQYQSSQKQIRFLSDHIKKMLSDKTFLEKKVTDLEKVKMLLEDSVRALKKPDYSSKQLKLLNSQMDNRHSMKINEEIDNKSCIGKINESILRFEELNISRESEKSLRYQRLGIPKKNAKFLAGSGDLNTISKHNGMLNFRKNKGSVQAKKQSKN